MRGQSILIIAISARPYVVAAKQAGYHVTVFDAYVDQETAESADLAKLIAMNESGFDADDLMQAVLKLNAKAYAGFIYGSGFEMQPDLLDRVAQYIPLLGNSASTVAKVKNAASFFSQLSTLKIPFPAVFDRHSLPNEVDVRYVCKVDGGSGGQQIGWLDGVADACKYEYFDHKHAYFQAYIKGLPVSVLFMVGHHVLRKDKAWQKPVLLIGLNEQWVESPTSFKFGGAVSGIELSARVKKNIVDIVARIAQSFDLLGLNSIDLIVNDEAVYVLEVNPRLSATFGLYAKDWVDQHNIDLIDLHFQVCCQSRQADQHALSAANQLLMDCAIKTHAQDGLKKANALAVVYAERDCEIKDAINWPEWVVDRPNALSNMQRNKQLVGVPFKVGMPICSVIASGENALAAKMLVQERECEIKRKINLEFINN